MTDEELLDLNRNGFIPGPQEKEKDFIERVEKAKENFQKGDWIPPAHWDWVREYLGQIFDVKPLYICAFYLNGGLTPWQGAASWIEGRSLKSVQLREGLRKGSYLGLYSREEILAHEAVHAVRSGFNEERSEEFFAYMTSEKKWRRVLGPILQRPWEAWPFLIAMIGGMFFPGCYLGGAIWTGIGFFRLIKQHRVLRCAGARVLEVVGENRTARAVLFRLTDAEIALFSKKGIDIKQYVMEQTELRWKVIRLAYF